METKIEERLRRVLPCFEPRPPETFQRGSHEQDYPQRRTCRTARKLPTRKLAPGLLVVTVVAVFWAVGLEQPSALPVRKRLLSHHAVAGLASLKTGPGSGAAQTSPPSSKIGVLRLLWARPYSGTWPLAVTAKRAPDATSMPGLTAGRRTSSTLGSALCLRYDLHCVRCGWWRPQLPVATTDFVPQSDRSWRSKPLLSCLTPMTSPPRTGVFAFTFTGVNPPGLMTPGQWATSPRPDPVFNVGGINVRGVEPRNTPTMITQSSTTATSGRPRAFEFNGRTPIGKLDPTATGCAYLVPGAAPRADQSDRRLAPPDLELDMLAGLQAVGRRSATWKCVDGRQLPDPGRKMCPRRPLAQQLVAPMTAFWAP